MEGKWRVKEGSVNGRAIGGLVGCKLGVEWSFGVVFERFLFLNGRCCGIAIDIGNMLQLNLFFV